MSSFELLNSFFTGAFGTFSQNEKSTAELIFSIASDEVAKSIKNQPTNDDPNHSDDEDQDSSFKDKIKITENNLLEIIELFEKVAEAKLKFKERYPNWSPLRKANSSRLRETANRINTDRHNCNIAKITSTTTGVLSGFALVGALLFPPAALVLGVGGAVVGAVSGATTFGTSITEVSLLKKEMNKAKEIVQKDEKDFKLVAMWFKHSQDFIDAVEKIISFKVVTHISEGLKSIDKDFLNFKNIGKGAAFATLKKLIKHCVDSLPVNGVLYVSCKEAIIIMPLVITFFFIAIAMRKHTTLIFDSVVICHRIVFGLMKLLDVSSDVGMAICNALLKAGATASAEAASNISARVIAHGVFAGFGVALDMTNMIISSIDVHNGSISPYAVQLQEAADQLEKEHKLVEEVYNALFQCK